MALSRGAIVLGAFVLFMVIVCGTAWANEFDGMESNRGVLNAYGGARADVDRYVPRYASGNHGVSAWSMLHDASAGDWGGFAQVGWARAGWWDNDVYYFYEYADETGHDQGPQIIGSVPNPDVYGPDDLFTVQLVSGGLIEYRVNGVTMHTSSRNWSPTMAEWYGEIENGNDQTPGDTNHKVIFNSIAEYSNGAWHALPPTGRMWNSTSYGDYSNTSSDFRIWDTRYSTEGNL